MYGRDRGVQVDVGGDDDEGQTQQNRLSLRFRNTTKEVWAISSTSSPATRAGEVKRAIAVSEAAKSIEPSRLVTERRSAASECLQGSRRPKSLSRSVGKPERFIAPRPTEEHSERTYALA